MEIFDIVDEHDEVIGQCPRAEVHQRRLRHRAAHILVFNWQGDVFLQRRSLEKECSPGLWDSSSAGHVEAGETYDECAVRELSEEIGLSLSAPLTRLFKVEASRETGMEFVWVYRCESEGPFVLDGDEIIEARWFSRAETDQLMQASPEMFSGTLRLIWQELTRSR